jgi:hypothetical protein
MTDYQVTLICTTGEYKPVSAIVSVEESIARADIIIKGTNKICQKRLWTAADLKKYHYTKAKIRVYDKEKIEAENKARYEAIKEAKYASGEWKRPKKSEKKA